MESPIEEDKPRIKEYSIGSLKDIRFLDGAAPVKEVFEAEEVLSALDKVLSQSVMERQSEQRRKLTELRIAQFLNQENTWKRKRMLYRFKAIARLMMIGSRMKTSIVDYSDYVRGTNRTTEQPMSSLPEFNVNLYMRQKYPMIPLKVKRIMTKPSWLRTAEEVDWIYRNISQLPFLTKYSQRTLQKIAAVIRYNFVEENRVVLRQGHMPLSFYFILSGCVLVFVDKKVEGEVVITRQVNKLKAGRSFGESALIHNTPRTATVTTKYDSELLSVDKSDFDVLLKETVGSDAAIRYEAICELPQFNSWDKEQLFHLSNNCQLVKYEDNKVILNGEEQSNPDFLYFILDGRCRIIESLRVTTASSSKKSRTFSVKSVTIDAKMDQVLASIPQWALVATRFLNILSLEKGQYFGTGEDLNRRYVVSLGRVECLKIPHIYLLRNEHGDWLEFLKDRLNRLVPSHKAVFAEFVRCATWRAYKKDLMAHLNQRTKKKVDTKMEDVPLSIRRTEEVENWNMIQGL